MSILNKIGLIGWEKIEPTIIASLIARKPILMIGSPGTSKTEGAALISKAFQGSKCEFRTYDVPALSPDDLLGVYNPADLVKGKLSFVQTPLSVWGKSAILLDEINCANPMTQSKLHELVRVQQIMGLETGIELVFAAINPPQKFQTNFMTLQLASRFVEVEVPMASSLDDDLLLEILISHRKESLPFYGKKLKEARDTKLTAKELKVIEQTSLRCYRIISMRKGILSYEGRSFKNLHTLLISYFQAEKIFKSMYRDEDSILHLVLSTIPEYYSAVRDTGLQKQDLEMALREALAELLEAGDKVKIKTLGDIWKVPVVDELNWSDAAREAIYETEDMVDLEIFRKDLETTKDLPKHIVNSLRRFSKLAIISNRQKTEIFNVKSLMRGL